MAHWLTGSVAPGVEKWGSQNEECVPEVLSCRTFLLLRFYSIKTKVARKVLLWVLLAPKFKFTKPNQVELSNLDLPKTENCWGKILIPVDSCGSKLSFGG